MSKKSKATQPAKFAVGDRVRVKAGVSDPDYPDMPLGGWAGTVAEVDAGKGLTYYLVRFNRSTLANVNQIYRNRCERDGLDLDEMSLVEEELEPDIGEPLPIEQPTNIITKPLSMLDQDDRLKAAFGLTSDDQLPNVDEESLLSYHKYLGERLTLPFAAEYFQESRPMDGTHYIITVLALLDPEEFMEDEYGLFCEAIRDKQTIWLPLAEVKIARRNPNYQFVSDYLYWLVNWR